MSVSTPTIPQPVLPFQLGSDGYPGICEQGSTQDVASKALLFLSCPQGANPYDPEFGLPAQLFGALPLNTQAVLAALREYMPELQDPTVTQTVIDTIANLSITGFAGGD